MPRKKTTLPATPVSQPITDTFTPSPGPEYQPVNAETARTTPASRPEAVADADDPALEQGFARYVSVVEGHRLHSMEHRARQRLDAALHFLNFTAWRNSRVNWNRRTCPSSTTRQVQQTVRLHRARRKARIAHRKRTEAGRDSVLGRARRPPRRERGAVRHDLARDPTSLRALSQATSGEPPIRGDDCSSCGDRAHRDADLRRQRLSLLAH